MFSRIRAVVERHFGLIFALSFVLGLMAPGLERLPDELVGILIAVVIFLSCFKVDYAADTRLDLKLVLSFYLVRFGVYPPAVLALTAAVYPELQTAVLLWALLPVGVTVPALTGINGGRIGLALGLVLLSSMLAPLVVPGVFAVFSGPGISVPSFRLFSALIWLVIVPFLVHLPLRRLGPVKSVLKKEANFVSVISVAVSIFVVNAKQRTVFFQDPGFLLPALALLFVIYGGAYLLIWFLYFRQPWKTRLTLTLCSGANNNGLGIALALLYLPPKAALFMVLTEVPWTLLIAAFSHWAGRRKLQQR